MGVLSNRALIAALDEGRLVIDPRPTPGPAERDTPYDTISVDLPLAPIHPGFTGNIALEMINLGKIPLTLRPGQRVCQIIVETVEGEPIRADSQFQCQRQATG